MTVLPLPPDELLTTTRSVRKRLDLARPVPVQLVRECLEVALQAPTGSNRQGWHWVVVTDPDLRAGIAEYYKRSYDAYRNSRRTHEDAARRATQQRVASSSDHLAEHMADVPVLVLACIEAAEELPAENQAGLWGSLLPAAWSYQLAARARGLGSAWTTLHLRYEREVSQLLGIPPNVCHGVLLPTAYFSGDVPAGPARAPGPGAAHRPLVAVHPVGRVVRPFLCDRRHSTVAAGHRRCVVVAGVRVRPQHHSYRVVLTPRYADRDPDHAALLARPPLGRRGCSPHG